MTSERDTSLFWAGAEDSLGPRPFTTPAVVGVSNEWAERVLEAVRDADASSRSR